MKSRGVHSADRLARRILILLILAGAVAFGASAQQPHQQVVSTSAVALPASVGLELQSAAIAVDGTVELASSQDDSVQPTFSSRLVLQQFDANGNPTVPSFPLATPPSLTQSEPSVAALVPGGFVVAWQNFDSTLVPSVRVEQRGSASVGVGAANTLSGRIVDANGQSGPEFQVGLTTGDADVRVSGLSSGGFVATYVAGTGVAARIYDASGTPISDEVPFGTFAFPRNVGVVALGDGGFVAAWADHPSGLYAQRFNAAGASVGAAIHPLTTDYFGPANLAANPAGEVTLAWNTVSPLVEQGSMTSLLAQRFDSTLNALAPPQTIGSTDRFGAFPVVTRASMNLKGETLVTWSQYQYPNVATGMSQLLNAQGLLTGLPVVVGVGSNGVHSPIGIAAAPDGSWTVVTGADNSGAVNRLSSAQCSPQITSLCLAANRFRLDVSFVDPRTGATGTAQPVDLDEATGGFWFFDPRNPELIIKVLDGSAVNGHLWVFYASLSNVEFDITVTDGFSGAQKTYHNAAGVQASQADTSAFVALRPEPGLAAAAATSTHRARAPHDSPNGTICNSAVASLCLGTSRFSATVSWTDTASGQTGTGTAQQLSAESGVYWFFDPSNAELAVKILDGTAINGRFWVFYASLTDVQFDLTITDNQSPTHASKTYHNRSGVLASQADTSAF